MEWKGTVPHVCDKPILKLEKKLQLAQTLLFKKQKLQKDGLLNIKL
jgi:hypothetical protein